MSNHWHEGSMFHCVFSPPCLCPITDRRVLCSTVPLVHRVSVSPQECSMLHRVFSSLCLCPITDMRVLCATVSLVHRVYISLQEGFIFHYVFSSPCQSSITERRVLCSTVSLVYRVWFTTGRLISCHWEALIKPYTRHTTTTSMSMASVRVRRLTCVISTSRVTKLGLGLALRSWF